jgi:hypothetical protein
LGANLEKRLNHDCLRPPIEIPLIVAGVFLGRVWSSKNPKEIVRKTIPAGILSTLLNIGYVMLRAELLICLFFFWSRLLPLVTLSRL